MSTKCFLFFFLKNMADSYTLERKALLKRLNLAFWNMSRHSFSEYPI